MKPCTLSYTLHHTPHILHTPPSIPNPTPKNIHPKPHRMVRLEGGSNGKMGGVAGEGGEGLALMGRGGCRYYPPTYDSIVYVSYERGTPVTTTGVLN